MDTLSLEQLEEIKNALHARIEKLSRKVASVNYTPAAERALNAACEALQTTCSAYANRLGNS